MKQKIVIGLVLAARTLFCKKCALKCRQTARHRLGYFYGHHLNTRLVLPPPMFSAKFQKNVIVVLGWVEI
jgi:hypothetical protein